MRRSPTVGGMSIHCSEASTTNGFDLRWWRPRQHDDDSEEVPIQHYMTGLRQIRLEETEGTSVSDGVVSKTASRGSKRHTNFEGMCMVFEATHESRKRCSRGGSLLDDEEVVRKKIRRLHGGLRWHREEIDSDLTIARCDEVL
ncbi:hypothetical protein M6B38_363810 [Iris pallida]|uniref:Uncharacterized protein n=1 Tax=Iris pallida TaxID=29817 RepID=A0AAX6GIV8_IRIPA|nr:hypothetical protein M6B38_363810 [Iris pallida]